MLQMKDIIRKFIFPGGLVVYCYAGTFSVAHVCINLPPHRLSNKCARDLEVAIPSLPVICPGFVLGDF